MLTMADGGGRGVQEPPILADVICEQPLIIVIIIIMIIIVIITKSLTLPSARPSLDLRAAATATF